MTTNIDIEILFILLSIYTITAASYKNYDSVVNTTGHKIYKYDRDIAVYITIGIITAWGSYKIAPENNGALILIILVFLYAAGMLLTARCQRVKKHFDGLFEFKVSNLKKRIFNSNKPRERIN